MKFYTFVTLGLSVAAFSADDVKVSDWRAELLEMEGIGISVKALQGALTAGPEGTVKLEGALKKLASRDFDERESGRKDLLDGGENALKWLLNFQPSEDPELRRRVLNVIEGLQLVFRKDREMAVEHAVKSLLVERAEGRRKSADTGGMFFEWFGVGKEGLKKDYRQFRFENSSGRSGKVEGGRLIFAGMGGQDGDQRLILESKNWPGQAEFGNRFRVSTTLGGEDISSGAWHMGVTIGRVRVLFHPGMQGGSFRFERIDNRKYLNGTKGIGFKPLGDGRQWMSIDVTKMPDGDVRLDVLLEESGENGKIFKDSVTVDAGDIGDLSEVSLDRSGRTGGKAYFRDFMIRLNP
ncbi:MAG: hypothetical protein ABF382_10845 [Akkermansiaceae bacterium]